MIGIIPVAGNATRMNNILKFLLPIPKENKSLISWHIDNQLKFCEKIVIATKPENAILFKYLSKNPQICIYVVETETMSETVLRVMDSFPSEEYLLGMPDTYCTGENPYEIICNSETFDMSIALWNIQNEQIGQLGQVAIDKNNLVVDLVDKDSQCKYPFSWGVLKFKKNIKKFIKVNDLNIGFAIMPLINDGLIAKGFIINGKYFDCGTIEEYQRLFSYVYEKENSV